MSTNSPHLERLTALDGLRGVAALGVVFTHASLHLGLLPWPPLGGTGVLVFFVLSGYLIATIGMRLTPDASGYRAFLRRRIVRLGPVAVAVAVLVPSVLVLAKARSAERAVGDGLQVLTQTTGLLSASEQRIHESLMPSWSLTTEWTFYLLFPVFLLIARRRGVEVGRIASILVGAAVVLFLAALPLGFRVFYLAPVANVGVMCAGAALALAHHVGWEGPHLLRDGPGPGAGLAMVVLLVPMPGAPLGWAYDLAVFPAVTLATVAVIHGVHRHRAVERVLSTAWLGAVGVRAYSLYLWHLPALWLAWWLVPGHRWLALLLGLGLTSVVTLASFAVLERPVLRRPQGARGRSSIPSQA